MTDVDAKLVEQITAAVLQALGRGGVGDAPPAHIHAPIGTCTGDYSKFPELTPQRDIGRAAPGAAHPGLEGVAGNAASAALSVASAGGPTAPEPVLAGLITANRLQGLQGSVLYLAAGARLSPLAMDEVKKRKLQVQQVAADGGGRAAPTSRTLATWCCWVQGHCATAARVIEQYDGRPIAVASAGNSGESVLRVIERMAQSLRQGEFRHAVIFVPTAGVAACMANRCAHVRAVVGTSTRSVQEGVVELGANMLVIEYPQHGYQTMAAMLEVFLKSTGAAPARMQKELAGLARDAQI